jgi:hypothetical protein
MHADIGHGSNKRTTKQQRKLDIMIAKQRAEPLTSKFATNFTDTSA